MRKKLKNSKSDIREKNALEELEIRLLLEGIYEYNGYDFRNYAAGTLKRGIRDHVQREGLQNVSELLAKVLHDPNSMDRLIGKLTISVSTMFRDPSVFAAIREQVVPFLRTYPFIRVWHAGCAKGEEVYSMAILLHEEGLYNKCRIYATDLSEETLFSAKKGIYRLDQMQEYTRNYLAAGGKEEFSEYYTAMYGNVIFKPWLQENIVFSRHNLVIDGPFNEFNIILCRNVMIFFNHALQARVFELFYNSLATFGILVLGRHESIRLAPHESDYEVMNMNEKIYKKVKVRTLLYDQ